MALGPCWGDRRTSLVEIVVVVVVRADGRQVALGMGCEATEAPDFAVADPWDWAPVAEAWDCSAARDSPYFMLL